MNNQNINQRLAMTDSAPTGNTMASAVETAFATTHMIFTARPDVALALDCFMALTAFALENEAKAGASAPAATAHGFHQPITAAAIDVLAERRRQIVNAGHSPVIDDGYEQDVLARGAAAYAVPGLAFAGLGDDVVWPWSPAYFNPKDRRQDLVRAGALILAEIERLDRASAALSAGEPA